MLSPTDNSYSSPLPKPAAGGLLDDPSGTASTQPIANPKPLPTQPLALAPNAPASTPIPPLNPDGPSSLAPLMPSAPAPAPVATPDPLAFGPAGGVLSSFTPSGPTPVAAPMPSDTTPMMTAGQGINETSPQTPPTSTSAAPSTLPAVPAPTQAPLPSAPSTPAPIPTDANGMPSYSTTPTTPDNSLINSTITPGPATDRYAIAQKEYDDWVAQSDPQFQAQMRDANRYSAAAGRIGSGQATNSIGDIATQRENATRSARDSFLGNALTGSIDDAYKNVGIAQQQQGFQAGQQETAFGQNVQLQQLANSEQGQQYTQMMQSLGFNATQIQQAFDNAYRVQQMSNSQDAQSFYQALEQEIQGSQGDPAQILAWISGQYARGGA